MPKPDDLEWDLETKQSYEKRANTLEKNYEQNGLLDENDRRRFMKNIKEKIRLR